MARLLRLHPALLLLLVIAAPTLVLAFAASSASTTLDRPGAGASPNNKQQQEQQDTHRGLERKTAADYVVLEHIAHDPKAFTQGLVYEPDGDFLEGTGLYGKSMLRRVNAKTGDVVSSQNIPHEYFGEGIVAVDDKVIQITWKERKALVYGRQNLTFLHDFVYSTSNNEGWGITTDGTRLIVSDGSSNLHFWDKDTYKEIPNSRLRVEDDFGNAVRHLNELEYAYGYVWANVWLADDIIQIDPNTGKVVAFYDFSSLYPSRERKNIDQVLNGIAFDPQEDVFYLTGKWWPEYFKIKICGVGPAEKDAGVCTANPQAGGGNP